MISRPSDTAEPRTSITSWTISPTSEESRYTAVTGAVIEAVGQSGIIRDSVTTTIGFALAVSRNAAPATYSARLQSMSIQGGSRAGQLPVTSGISLPLPFTGRIEPGRITLELAKAQAEALATCASEALAAIPVIQRAIVLVPLQLQTGMTWTDSTVTSGCTGPVPASITHIRIYRVNGQVEVHSQLAIVLDQQTRTSFTGEGAQGQHRIRIRGEGSGRSELRLDPVTGALIDAQGDNVTAITITASGRDQRFSQTVRERIARVR